MNKLRLLLTMLVVSICAVQNACADVEINETNFPDANFRNFLLSQSYGQDGVITDAEIAKITSITMRSLSIQNLKGIEFFTALIKLDCRSNQLTMLDVSKNTALTQLTCHHNQLTALDVSGCTSLTYLDCRVNQLKALDVSKNTALTDLNCFTNQLTALDVTKNSALTSLNCFSNQLTALDVSNNTALTSLRCSSNQLTTIDVSKNITLTSLDCSSNQLTTLDVSNNTALTSLSCSSNQLTTIDVSKNITLTSLDCSSNQLTTLDVSNNTTLTLLVCGGNPLTALNISQNTALESLGCNNNQLTTLDVSNNTAMTRLDCSGNNLTSIDVSKNAALSTLYCDNNLLTTLDVSKNTSLKKLSCYCNQIKGEAMDALVASLPQQTNGEVYVINNENEGNVMTVAQVAAAKERDWTPMYLSGEDEYGNKIWEEYAGSEPVAEGIAINETNFPDAKFRSCLLEQDFGSDGVITNEEIATIKTIDVTNKNVQSLKGIEYFTALTQLQCMFNSLTSLDVSKNTRLLILICQHNLLTSLDVSNNPNLILLNIACNKIKGKAMDDFVASLPQKDSSYTLTVADMNDPAEGNVMTPAQVAIVKSKNWKPMYTDGVTEYEGVDEPVDGIAINETNFPDAYFRTYLLSQSYGSDGVITDAEMATITSITVVGENIQSLKGIEFFTALTSLSCNDNQLTELDMSKNTALEGVFANKNQLSTLDLSNCTALKELDLDNNNLSTLDVTNCVALKKLDCSGNNLTSIDVSKNAALSTLYCDNNQLTTLDVSKNTSLRNLYCSGNQLTSLDLSKNTALDDLDCSTNKLTALDVSKNTALTIITCYQNQIKGEAMDAFIASLPIITSEFGQLYIIYLENEGNVMTTTQVAATKARNWTPFECVAITSYGDEWKEFAGSEVIEPITEETTVSFGGDSGIDENTNLTNTVVEDVLYTLDTTSGDGYDNTDQSITIVSTMSNTDIAEMEALIPGTPEFAEKFNGITLELATGEGSVTFDCQTVGDRQLTVKIGNAPAATYTKSERGEVKVAYNVAEPTFMYIYATATSAARGTEPTAAANALKLYGYTVKPSDTTGINGIESDNATTISGSDVYFDLNGHRVTTPTKGVYIRNGKKIVIK